MTGDGARAGRRIPLAAADDEAADRGPVLITGGAGFVGCNLAHRMLAEGRQVTIFDNLSRPGVDRNLAWLTETHGARVRLVVGDVRDAATVRAAVWGSREVYHFAAQVAVTTSLRDPVGDFDVNARGTLNLLEAVRAMDDPPSVLFTSTNKVYGAIEDVPLVRAGRRYVARSTQARGPGVSESRALDFHSPYGCSKGTADQYVLDYARAYGLRTIVFRMSCIYGPHQYGTEDQGWVAHFLLRALRGEPIALYGDGLQVRDVLFVDDLIDAMRLAQRDANRLAGEVFNIGGGSDRTVSLVELLDLIEELHGNRPPVTFHEWRTGDQRWYVSDTGRFTRATGWTPTVDVRDGVARLYKWLRSSGAAGAARRTEPVAPGQLLTTSSGDGPHVEQGVA